MVINKAAALLAGNIDSFSHCSLNLLPYEKSSSSCLSPSDQNPAKSSSPLYETAETMFREKPLMGKQRLDNRILFMRMKKIVNSQHSVLNKILIFFSSFI